MDVFKPVRFKRRSGGAYSVGYKAQILPKACHIFLDAKEAGKLVPSQFATADRCKILSRGFGEVGIIALVDEATGYQEIRNKQALQAILDAFLRQELAAWAKRFPDEFYREMFRLRGWEWNQLSKKRPILVGKLTNAN